MAVLSVGAFALHCGGDEQGGADGPGASIGPAGGMLESSGVRLTIPEAALETPVVLSARVEGAAPAGTAACSPIFRFEPAGTRFLRPVDVTFQRPADCGAAPVVFWTDDAHPEEWLRLPTQCEGEFCRASIDHFSFGFLGTLDTSGPESCGGQTCEAPAAACEGGDRVRHYGPAHTCSADGCAYPGFLERCAGGCVQGRCVCAPTERTGCHNGDVVQFDSCGQPLATVAACASGCDLMTGACTGCTPQCGQRGCGPDPVCGAPCGSGCGAGQECTGAGQCVDRVCRAGQRQCTSDGFGFIACEASATDPRQSDWGRRIPCDAGVGCDGSSGRCEVDPTACRSTEVMMVLDRSSSLLRGDAWQWVRAGLESEVKYRSIHSAIGLRQFPAGAACDVSDPLPLGRSYSDFVQAIEPPDVGSATPITAALTGLLPAFGDPNDGQAVVLLTDGEESCDTQATATDAAAHLFANGVQVYVVALTTTANTAALDAIAAAGGTGRSLLAHNPADLKTILYEVFEELQACRFRPEVTAVAVPVAELASDRGGDLMMGDPTVHEDEWWRVAPIGPGEAPRTVFAQTWAADGSALAYTAGATGLREGMTLYILDMPVGVSQARAIHRSGPGARIEDIDWLGGQRHVLFTVKTPTPNGSREVTTLHVADALTGEVWSAAHPITGFGAADDGSQVAYQEDTDEGTKTLQVLALTPGAFSVRSIDLSAVSDAAIPATLVPPFRFSPDGAQVAFRATLFGGLGLPTHLFTVPAAGGPPVRISGDPVEDGRYTVPAGFVWSPDGRWLSFVEHESDVEVSGPSLTGSLLRVRVYEAAGSGPAVTVSAEAQYDKARGVVLPVIRWSPDSRQLFGLTAADDYYERNFTLWGRAVTDWAVTDPAAHVISAYSVPIDSGVLAWTPMEWALSPAGAHIVYQHPMPGDVTLVAVADGKAVEDSAIELVTGAGHAHVWSTDGRRVFVVGHSDASDSTAILYAYDLDGNRLIPVDERLVAREISRDPSWVHPENDRGWGFSVARYERFGCGRACYEWLLHGYRIVDGAVADGIVAEVRNFRAAINRSPIAVRP